VGFPHCLLQWRTSTAVLATQPSPADTVYEKWWHHHLPKNMQV